MPDSAVHAAFDEVLSPQVDERLLTPLAGVVVFPSAQRRDRGRRADHGRNAFQVADDLGRLATHLWGIAGIDPVALSIDPVED
ncbi:hypothetical protein [Terrabacter sp. BE26]|uniref:hypothetical protein n=1 Tax=Terrabacter sp. BE26 TaxID=2898152 RepID=UPI0035BE15F9